MINVNVFCFLASYTVVYAMEWIRPSTRGTAARVLMIGFTLAGLIAHSIYLIARSRETQLPPLLSSVRDWMLVLAWLGAVHYLFLTLMDRRLAVGLFLLPIVLAIIIAAYFVGEQPTIGLDAHRGWAMLHAALLVFGIGGILLGLCASLMYLFQHHRLKHKRGTHSGLPLPSLERLARLNWWAIMFSVPMLTLGLASGLLLVWLSNTVEPMAALKDPLAVCSTLLWVVLVGFFVRLVTHQPTSGRQVAWMTLWSFGFLLVTLLGLQSLSTAMSGRLGTLHSQTTPDCRAYEAVVNAVHGCDAEVAATGLERNEDGNHDGDGLFPASSRRHDRQWKSCLLFAHLKV